MKSETLRFAPMGIENFKDAFNKMPQDPEHGSGISLVQDPQGSLLPGLFGQATVTELFEGARAMTYQIRETQTRQLLATVDVKRVHLERVPADPDRLNGLKVRVSWTEPAVSVARRVLVWLAMNFDGELPAWIAAKDAEENQVRKDEEPKGAWLLARGR